MNNPIIIPMEDDLIHTDKHPLCNDTTCPCHLETPHRHVVFWECGKFYCFECWKALNEEETKAAMANCEMCGFEFEQDDPQCYFELGEYSYCGECCNW